MHVHSAGIFFGIPFALEILFSCTEVEDPFPLFSGVVLLRQWLCPNRLVKQVESFDSEISVHVQGIIDIRAGRNF